MIKWLVPALLLGLPFAQGQKINKANQGHSHNDYKQSAPFSISYGAKMGSIEADIFLKDGKLYVAHELSEIAAERTLKNLYLEPLKQAFEKNGKRAYPEKNNRLQLVIDLKQPAHEILPALEREILAYKEVFDPANPDAVKLVLSGDIPAPADFDAVSKLFSFDGRPNINYTAAQLSRIAMISDQLSNYTVWNGKGNPTAADQAKLRKVIESAHQVKKPFRFWGSQDSPNTWIVLRHLGVDWINTDVPERLNEFYANEEKVTYQQAAAYPTYQVTHQAKGDKVKNVILLIGDGMGLAQIHAALMGNHGALNLSQFQHIGFSGTTAKDAGNTDSAAGGTAIATGSKTNNRFVGVDQDGKPLLNIVDSLFSHNIQSAIISTGDLTDATPAAFYAHQSERSLSNEIAADLLKSKASILIGSNQDSFLKNTQKDLPEHLAKAGFNIHKSLKELKSISAGRQLVLLPDTAVRPVLEGRGHMLSDALNTSIALLNKDKKGFFIMAEGAQIDHGGHANDLPRIITELHDFDKAVGEALKFADQNKETLVIVTADHETGGLSLLDAEMEKGMVRGHFSTNDHTNIVVPVFAYGPGATHFTGFYQNNEIFYKLLKSFKQIPAK